MNLETAHIALKKYFGYDQFRPMQADIVQTIYDKKDCLVLMPTGGGKSVCFQIPAVTMEGITVVVSPLISLMKDQVESLKVNGINAAFLNSSQSYNESQIIENQLFANELKLLYVSPEKMVSQGFLSLLKKLNINLFAIDEAHCISAWGHDFRPEYTQLGFLKNQFPHIPVVALTATADKLTRKDIVSQLNLNDPSVFIASFDRPNLSLEVRPGQKRIEQILEFVKSRKNQVGIIYCLSRKSTEDLAVKLLSSNIKAAAYHANLGSRERSQVQEDFINDKIQVVCATVAFGMGIDKSNVRWVIHYNLPKNIESYYQEIGRAGRDGAPADTILFYSIQDVNIYRDMFGEGGGGNTDVQNAKLDRMLQFADAQICRRTILLNYFNEHHEGNCGNCDVCESPPQYFDGTKVAQMALSAVTRLHGEANMSLLIDVLRGSGKHEIIEKGFDKIKTYGIGRNIPPFEWQSYLWQIIQLGLLDIAYDDKHKLKLTPASNDTLFKNKEVKLLKPLSIKEREDIKRKVVEAKTKADVPRMRIRNELFDFLREFRRNLALEKGVPPYVVFSDATLGEMSAIVPQDEAAFRSISGVGEQKWQQFGELFLSKIEEFLKGNPQFVESGAVNQIAPKIPKEPAAPKEKEAKVHTTQITFDMFSKGMTVEEIAEQRFLSPLTISTHLIQFYEQGIITDVYQFVSAEEVQTIGEALDIFPEPYKLREIFEYFSENFSYDKIRWAIAYREKHKATV
jgi:ATP-dependent DNA helicase RecQ